MALAEEELYRVLERHACRSWPTALSVLAILLA